MRLPPFRRLLRVPRGGSAPWDFQGQPTGLLYPELRPRSSPACVNFSNICFPWALAGLGWAGREFLRLSEAAVFPFHPCRLSSAREAVSNLPLGSSLAEPPSEALRVGVSAFLISPASHPTWKGGLEALGGWCFAGLGLPFKHQDLHKAIRPRLRFLQDPTAMGRPISQKSPLIRLDNLVAKSPASLLGNPLPTQSFGPGWDKGHTVSPGGEGRRGWRKVALLATQGPIQPGAWLSRAGWLGPAAVTASLDLGITAASLGWMGGLAGSSFRSTGWGPPLRPGMPEPCPCVMWTTSPVSRGTQCPSCCLAQNPCQNPGEPRGYRTCHFCFRLP